jgi:RHS repeat-associated protein
MSTQLAKRLCGALRRAGWAQIITMIFAALLARCGPISASSQIGSNASALRDASADHLAPPQQRPVAARVIKAKQAANNPVVSSIFPTTAVPPGSTIPWNIEWLCGGLDPIDDTVTGMYSSVKPPNAGVTVTGVPSSIHTFNWFILNVNVASTTAPGTYGVGVFGDTQNTDHCGPYATAATVEVLPSKANLGCRKCKAGNQCLVGDPINVAAGNLYEDELDFRSIIGTLPLKIERSFNSSNRIIGQFGDDWTSNLDVVLFGGSTASTARLPDGQEIGFNYNGSGWVPQTTVPATLTVNSGGYLLVMTTTGDQYQFNSSGQITSQKNIRGEQLTYTRDPSNTYQIQTVSDNYNNSMSLTYNTYKVGGGTFSVVRTASVMGKTFTYYYDTTNLNLKKVTYTLNNKAVSRQYQYYAADSYQLTGIVDETNTQIANFGYDDANLPNHSDRNGTESVDVDYTHLFSSLVTDGTPPSVTVTNANGFVQEYDISYGSDGIAYIGAIVDKSSPNGNVALATTYTVNNSQGLPAITVDGNGHGTEYTYDSKRAILTQVISGYQWNGTTPITTAQLSGTSAMRKWHVTELDPVFPYPKQIVYSGKNASSQWVDTKQIDAVYDPTNGRLTSWEETDKTGNAGAASPRLWKPSYTYYDAQKTQVKQELVYGPRYVAGSVNDVTELDYDASGRLTTKKDGSGHSWTYGPFTATGMPQQIQDDQNGTITAVLYDEKDRPTSITLASGTPAAEVEQIFYYANGRVKKTTRPDGSSLTYVYDPAGDINEIDDSAGNKTTLTPNTLDGQWTYLFVNDANGSTAQMAQRGFDDIGRLMTVTGSFGEQANYAYDLDDNVQSSYRNGDTTTELVRVYDALGRVKQLKRELIGGGALKLYVTNTFDPTGLVAQVKDPRGLDTIYTTDGFGDRVKVQSPDTGTTSFVFDTAGNVTQRLDNKGQTLKYSYDAINRLKQIVRVDTGQSLATYTYDQTDGCGQPTAIHGCGYGRLTSILDLTGTTDFSYDPAGHLLSKTQITSGVTLKTTYTYFPGTDDVQTMTLPSSNVLSYTWDKNGHITSISLTKAGTIGATALVSNVKYQPFNGPLSWKLGNGEAVGRQYDVDGAVSGDPVDAQIDYTPDKTSLVDMYLGGGSTFSAPNVVYSGSRSFGTDNLDHATGLSGSVAVGSGTAQSLSLIYGYDLADNRKSQTIGTSKTTYTPSATNNQLASSTKGSTVTNYYYDGNGNLTGSSSTTPTYGYDFFNRLTSYTSGSTSATYGYNGRSERVIKTVGSSAATLFVYDEAGRVIGEYNGATPIEETVYLGDMPIAVLEPSGTYYVHADHRNAPRQIDDAGKHAVWAWDPQVYGDTMPVQNPPGSTFVYNLRFPGQYYDVETGNSYNYFRDYNSATGRYLESDPSGLLGGVNTYGYADASPLVHTDPLGLLSFGVSLGLTREAGIGNAGFGQTVTWDAGVFVSNQYLSLLLNPATAGVGILLELRSATFSRFKSVGHIHGTDLDACDTSYPNYPGRKYKNVVLGAYVGVGIGGWGSNASDVGQLTGPFDTQTLNTPVASGQSSTGYDSDGNPISQFTVSKGPGLFGSVSSYPTYTSKGW